MKRLFNVTMQIVLEDLSEEERASIAAEDSIPVDDLGTIDDVSSDDLTEILELAIPNKEFQKAFWDGTSLICQLTGCTIERIEEQPTVGRRIGVDGGVTHVDLTVPHK
jgi:hypothetical protein